MRARDGTSAPCWVSVDAVDSYEDTLRISSIRVDTIFAILSPQAFRPDVKTEQCLTTGPRHRDIVLRCSPPSSTALSLEEGWGGSLQHTLLGDGCY